MFQHRRPATQPPGLDVPGITPNFVTGGSSLLTMTQLQSAPANTITVQLSTARFVMVENHTGHSLYLTFKTPTGVIFSQLLTPSREKWWNFPLPVDSVDIQDLSYNSVVPQGKLNPDVTLTQRDGLALAAINPQILSGGIVLVSYADHALDVDSSAIPPEPPNFSQTAGWAGASGAPTINMLASGASALSGVTGYGLFSGFLILNTSNTLYNVYPFNLTLGQFDTYAVPAGSAFTLPVECDKLHIVFTNVSSGLQQVTAFQRVSYVNTQGY